MTTHDEHDNDLKPYLEGKDAVSSTYRKVAGEQPPAELDALILQAAADAVAKPEPQPGASRRQYYAMAASLCLGVLLTSLYYEQQAPMDTGPLIITASVDQRQVGELDLVGLVAAGAGVAQGAAESVARAESVQQGTTPSPAAPAPATSPPQAVSPTPQVTGAPISTVELLEPAAVVRMVIPGQNSQRIVNEFARTGATANPNITADSRARTLWLDEIMRLISEAEALAGETAALRQRVEEEKASFSASYPDFDLDAALAE